MFPRRRSPDAERELESLKDTLASLSRDVELREKALAAMPQAVMMIEADGSIVYANKGAQELLRSDPSIGRTLATGGSPEFALHHPHHRVFGARIVAIEGDRKVAVIDDITEAKRLEAMRRDLVADVSHELKTPVAGILAAAETVQLSIDDDPPGAQRFARSIHGDAQRLSRLVEDLLDLARVEHQHPAGALVDLAAVVGSEVSRVVEAARQKGLFVDVEVVGDTTVLGQVEDLALAIRNLLMNAVGYTEAGGVTVRLKQGDGAVVLRVEDSGVGIPTRDLPRIFERFYRVDKGRSRETGGTGLGLSIVKHVVERHGGTVAAESSLGVGSTFILTLPPAAQRADVGGL